jgi:hypothetical protein
MSTKVERVPGDAETDVLLRQRLAEIQADVEKSHSPPAELYAVGRDWEHNQYDDSDWYQCGYDPAKDAIVRVCIGTTRWAQPVKNLPSLPEDMRPRAQEALRRLWVERLVASHTQAVEYPDEALLVGRVVELKKPVRNREREEQPCAKCGGAGSWTNPKRPEDVRRCFGCQGTGVWVGGAVLGGAWLKLPAGTTGKVIRVFKNRSQFGTWDYGSRLEILKEDGIRFKAGIESCRLHNVPINMGLVEAMAAERAARMDAYPLFPSQGTYNFGLQI